MKKQQLAELPQWFLEKEDSVNILYGMLREDERRDIKDVFNSNFVFQTSDQNGIYVSGVATEEESLQLLEDADSRGHSIDWVYDTVQGLYREVKTTLVLGGDR